MFETIMWGIFSAFLLDIMGILDILSTGVFDLTNIYISVPSFYILIILGLLIRRYIKKLIDRHLYFKG